MGSVSARPEEAIRFLQFLFPDGPWKVTAMLDGKTKKIETRTFTPGGENVLKGWAGQLNDAGWNIYYQPAMWDRRTDRAKKVSKSDILFLSVHWADFDSGPESVEECVKLLAEGDTCSKPTGSPPGCNRQVRERRLALRRPGRAYRRPRRGRSYQ